MSKYRLMWLINFIKGGGPAGTHNNNITANPTFTDIVCIGVGTRGAPGAGAPLYFWLNFMLF